jgi:exopolysaccharide biosynthesis polyprenyl glycosylphosphotransferase
MALWTKGDWNFPVFWNTAEVGPEPASRLRGFGPTASFPWSKPNGSNGWHNARRKDRYLIGGIWVQITYVLIDALCVSINGVLAFLVRFSPADLHRFVSTGHLTITTEQPLSRYGAFLLLYVALVLLLCEWQDLYRTPRTRTSREESFAVSKVVLIATFLLTAFIYLSGVKIISRLIVLSSLLLNTIALIAWRYAKRRLIIHRVERGIGARHVAIIGAGAIGQALARQLETDKHLGYRFLGFLDENHSDDSRMLGTPEDLPRLARSLFLDEIFITIPFERELVKRIVLEARDNRLDVKVVPDLYDGLGWNAPIRHVGDFPIMDLLWRPIPILGFFFKRVLDVFISGVLLIAFSPFTAALALWIRFDSPGPLLYRSRRVGRKGRVFTCYKLRTMVVNADELKDSLRQHNERQGPFFKITNDPRITRAGRILRKYSLDELLQLWNVFKGDMSLVGPRPHPVDDFERYNLEHLRRLDVKPGMTGLWQVTARGDPSFETNLALDVEYIENWNLGLDLKILLRTIPAVLRAEGH